LGDDVVVGVEDHRFGGAVTIRGGAGVAGVAMFEQQRLAGVGPGEDRGVGAGVGRRSTSASARSVAPTCSGPSQVPLSLGSPEARSTGWPYMPLSQAPYIRPPATPDPRSITLVQGQWSRPLEPL
jgi:hypothetical protein